MVVTDFDVVGITIDELKANPPLIVDGDGMLTVRGHEPGRADGFLAGF